jgi:hypothetical protein
VDSLRFCGVACARLAQVFVTRLDDDAALKKAADFMGEVFIFAARSRSRCATRTHAPDTNDPAKSGLSHSVHALCRFACACRLPAWPWCTR